MREESSCAPAAWNLARASALNLVMGFSLAPSRAQLLHAHRSPARDGRVLWTIDKPVLAGISPDRGAPGSFNHGYEHAPPPARGRFVDVRV
jgi:hypothetical protein